MREEENNLHECAIHGGVNKTHIERMRVICMSDICKRRRARTRNNLIAAISATYTFAQRAEMFC